MLEDVAVSEVRKVHAADTSTPNNERIITDTTG